MRGVRVGSIRRPGGGGVLAGADRRRELLSRGVSAGRPCHVAQPPALRLSRRGRADPPRTSRAARRRSSALSTWPSRSTTFASATCARFSASAGLAELRRARLVSAARAAGAANVFGCLRAARASRSASGSLRACLLLQPRGLAGEALALAAKLLLARRLPAARPRRLGLFFSAVARAAVSAAPRSASASAALSLSARRASASAADGGPHQRPGAPPARQSRLKLGDALRGGGVLVEELRRSF